MKSEEEDADPIRLTGQGWLPLEEGKQVHEDVLCDHYSFPEPLAKGKTAEVTLMATIINVITPHPAEIIQGQSQMVMYNDSSHIISPHKIITEISDFMLNSDKPESDSAPEPKKFEKKKLSLGPFSNIQPYTTDTFYIHYVNHFPFMHATHALRTIDVSHWGSVHFEETYQLTNKGAKLIGEFSRFNMATNPSSTRGAGLQFPAIIPKNGYDIYYRDDIGNISSSSVRKRPDSIYLMLEPRYPVFGGWSTKFTLGFRFPLDGIVFKQQGSQYLMGLTVLPVIKEVVYDEVEVRVILPEGARNPQVELALPYERHDELQYSYLDVLGRPVVVLKLHNLTPEGNSPIRIAYSYNSMYLAQKPLVFIAVLMAILSAVSFVLTLDNKADAWAEKEEKLNAKKTE